MGFALGTTIALLKAMNFNSDNKKDAQVEFKIGSANNGIYSQEIFRDLLVHERKRSERSKNQLFFVALNIKEVLTGNRSDIKVINTIIKSITRASREIDIKGWYESQECIGIIYTEVTGNAYDQILNKIRNEFSQSLNDALSAKISITYTLFPELDGKHWTEDRSEEALLYPISRPATNTKKIQKVLKRFLDFSASSIGVALLSPLLMGVAILIKASSKGPAIFKQERIGLGGKKFMLYKFRSMYIHNDPTSHKDFVKNLIKGIEVISDKGLDPNQNPAYKIQNDPRVTFIGRILRATSIDELPQLFNVLLGDMSLVGPRPPLAYEVEEYQAWHRPRVVEVKPGITGLWQVKGRSKTTFDGMVRMDLDYIHNWSFWLDVKLLLKTPAAVVTTKGAY